MSAEAWRRIGSDLAPLDLAWQAWHFQHLRLDLRGRRATLGTSIDVRGSLAANWVGFGAAIDCGSSAATGGPWTPTVFCVALSACEARFAYVGRYVCMYVCTRCCIQLRALQACSSCTPGLPDCI